MTITRTPATCKTSVFGFLQKIAYTGRTALVSHSQQAAFASKQQEPKSDRIVLENDHSLSVALSRVDKKTPFGITMSDYLLEHLYQVVVFHLIYS